MNFRDVYDLGRATRRLSHDIPSDVDLVVGIPRSGLLAANLLCLYLDVPMTDVDGLCRGQIFETGNRHEGSTAFADVDTALVFDDSVSSGTQMAETRERLAGRTFPFDVEYGATYVTRPGRAAVDYWGEVVPTPRVFEWNVMHNSAMRNACVDIDGVLCRDPTPAENDDGENYRRFLREVDPNVVPNERVGCLVTCRLETYRDETEAWLDEHGVEYDTLVMMDHPSMEARRAAGDHAEYKARVYDETGASLFVESSHHQAVEIHETTGKPVYCYERNEMLRPGRIARAGRRSETLVSRFRERPVGFSRAAGKYVIRRIRGRLGRNSSERG